MLRFSRVSLVLAIFFTACNQDGTTSAPTTEADESPEFQVAMRILDAHFEHSSHKDFSVAVNEILGRPLDTPLFETIYDSEDEEWSTFKMSTEEESLLIYQASMELLENPNALDFLLEDEDALTFGPDDPFCSFDTTLDQESEEWYQASVAWGRCFESHWQKDLCEDDYHYGGVGRQEGERTAMYLYCQSPSAER